MTNFEKYKEDLMKIQTGFGVNKVTRKVTPCFNLTCEECIFRGTKCNDSNKLKWLYSDCKKSILTEDEINLIKLLGKMKGESYKYITRTKDGGIMLYVGKPTPHYDIHNNWYCCYASTSYFYINKKDNNTMFSNIQFGDGVYDIKNKCFIK